MEKVNLSLPNVLKVAYTVFAVAAFMSSNVYAQHKTSIAFNLPASVIKDTQNYTIDVGDISGHQIRIYEAHAGFSKDTCKFAGVRAVGAWVRDSSDYIDTNGRATGYVIWMMESGDKIFSRRELVRQTYMNADGSKRSVAHGVETIVGGTGTFRGIRGTLRVKVFWDAKGVLSELQYDGEYWLQD
jgi:hypothetical protein